MTTPTQGSPQKCCQCSSKVKPTRVVVVVCLDEDAPSPSTPKNLTVNGKPICEVCAHNISHSWRLGEHYENEIPSPVADEKGEVIPYGTYPNIDWS